MSGLIRGKPLVWVRDGMCDVVWVAESQFGTYTVEYTTDKTWCWSLTAMWDGDASLITNGESDSRELAQSACQADHDSRAMASVEVVPFEWVDGEQGWSHATHGIGSLAVSLVVFPLGDGGRHRWESSINNSRIDFGSRATKAEAITAAETFVRQLVMEVQ